jgi:hypothetical protein
MREKAAEIAAADDDALALRLTADLAAWYGKAAATATEKARAVRALQTLNEEFSDPEGDVTQADVIEYLAGRLAQSVRSAYVFTGSGSSGAGHRAQEEGAAEGHAEAARIFARTLQALRRAEDYAVASWEAKTADAAVAADRALAAFDIVY